MTSAIGGDAPLKYEHFFQLATFRYGGAWFISTCNKAILQNAFVRPNKRTLRKGPGRNDTECAKA
jgi:hypothetical protein